MEQAEITGIRDQASVFLQWVAEDKAHWLDASSLAFDKLGAPLYNLLPVKVLRDLSADQRFDAKQRARLIRVAWTRAFAGTLDGFDGAAAATPGVTEMLDLNPEIASTLDKVKKDYPSISRGNDFTLTILRNPRFNMLVNSPDVYWAGNDDEMKFDDLSLYNHNDQNWWCPMETDRVLGAVRNGYDELAGINQARSYNMENLKPLLEVDAVANVEAARERVLKNHPMVKSINWKEIASLAKAPSAPKLLTQAAIRWAKRSDGKDGAPEALALAVRATRYGCNWHGGHQAYSKPAQELLKAKFGTTTWAAATPYWFNCQPVEYDRDGKVKRTCTKASWPKQAPLK
jgi:hypothetical protein